MIYKKPLLSFLCPMKPFAFRYFNILPCIFYYMYNEQTNAQLTDSLPYCSLLYCSYMFERQRFILGELSLGAC